MLNDLYGSGSNLTSSVLKVRKKPLEVQAMYYDGKYVVAEKIVEWVVGNGGSAEYYANTQNIRIATLEGNMPIRPGWYVLRGVKGEFYPCEGDIFETTYDLL